MFSIKPEVNGWISRGLRHSAFCLALAATVGLAVAAPDAEAKEEVVVSVRPLGLITSALMEGIGEPSILLADGASPHHYALKPSDMRSLMAAKLVVWVGPNLERFLEKPLSRTEAHRLALSPGDVDTAHHDEEHEEHDHEHDEQEHDHGGVDVHPWLDPGKVVQMARQITAELEPVYPQDKARLQRNLANFEAQLARTDEQIAKRLKPLQARGFYVFHDAYSGFVEHYGLNQLGYFTLDPSRKPGARHLGEIREQLEAQRAVCVLSEPQFSTAMVESITSGLSLQHAELDPLATGVGLGPNAYTDYLLDLAGRFESCLSR